MARPGEGGALVWSAAYFFFLLFGYYLLRPLRDEMGIRGGLDVLPWLWTGTTLAMLAAVPAFGALVSRWPRRVFIPVTYRFFAANVLVFWALLAVAPLGATGRLYAGYAFYIWLSVFNLFAVSVFWGFMADLFTSEQGRRLFGAIGVGGTLGAIGGASVPALLVEGFDLGGWRVAIPPTHLMLFTALMLEAAVCCVRRLTRLGGLVPGRAPPASAALRAGPADPGPGVWEGVRLVARSPYLQGIAAYMLLYTLTSTFLYFEQAHVIDRHVEGTAARTAVFARIDLAVNVLTLLTQLFLTGRILTRLGVGVGLSLLPALTVAGFALLGVHAWLGVSAVGAVFVFQVLRRSMHYAVDRPTREVLYTVLGPDAKYKSKAFIDTFVYRGGDLLGAWTYGAAAIGGTVALVAAPAAGLWWAVGLVLARRQRALVAERAAGAAGPSAPEARRIANAAPARPAR